MRSEDLKELYKDLKQCLQKAYEARRHSYEDLTKDLMLNNTFGEGIS